MNKKKIIDYVVFLVIAVVIALTKVYLIKIIGTGLILLWAYYLYYKNRAIFYAIIANKYFSKNEMNLCATWYEKAIAVKTCPQKIKITYSYFLLRSGKIEKSKEVLEKVKEEGIEKNMNFVYKQNYSLILFKEGKIDEAIEIMKEIFDTYKTTSVYESLGYMYIEKGDLEKALEFNLRAKDYNDQDPIILDNLGQTYLLLKDYKNANEIYEKLFKSNPKFPDAFYNYGLVLSEMGKKDEALSKLNKALTLNFSFLSSVKKEQVEEKINELNNN